MRRRFIDLPNASVNFCIEREEFFLWLDFSIFNKTEQHQINYTAQIN